MNWNFSLQTDKPNFNVIAAKMSKKKKKKKKNSEYRFEDFSNINRFNSGKNYSIASKHELWEL